ncbi:MAG: hypothetical protein E7523_04730 [Ruminococcaceae bacterium]|nr:hypothetical protein [Oscillospiraceae bacterium]
MKNMNLQFFAEGAAEVGAEVDAAMQTQAPTDENTSAGESDDVAQPQTEPAGQGTQEPEPQQPDEKTLQQIQHIADGRMRMQDWQAQGERLKAFYPSFSFSELYNGNEDFGRLLRAGVSVRQAYEVTHLPQILTAAMQYAARKAAEKTANAMNNTAVRPQENGLSDRKAGLPTEKRVDNLTQGDIIRILERVGKGDKITF